jgi:proline iminopeptidase
MLRTKNILVLLLVIIVMIGGKQVDSHNNIQKGYVSVTGGKIWYKIIGSDQKGIPLLIVHGGPGASHDYLELLAGLGDERPVVFYDQLGSGNSDKADNKSFWTIARFVEEIRLIRKELNLKKLHILGQSWGTTLAVEYMLTDEPEGVMSLVLSGALLSTSRWIKDQRTYLAQLPEEVQEVITKSEESGDFSSSEYQEAMMTYYKLHLCRLESWPDSLNRTFAKLNASLYEYMWGPSEFSVTGTLKDYERVSRLKEIKLPVLFTSGRYDEAAPSSAKLYQSNLPDSEIYIFEDASHEHHLEKPEEYLKVVRGFLQSAEK